MNTRMNVRPIEIRWGHGTDVIPPTLRAGLEAEFTALMLGKGFPPHVTRITIYYSKSNLPTRVPLPDERYAVMFYSSGNETVELPSGLLFLCKIGETWRFLYVPPYRKSSSRKRR